MLKFDFHSKWVIYCFFITYQCLILHPVKYTFEYLLHELSDMLHIWDMYPTQCVVPLTVKERAFWPFSLLFAT